VLHSTKLADRQPLARRLELLVADVAAFAGLQTSGRSLVGCSNSAVTGNVFFGLFSSLLLSLK
jgi:hypothetical protein